MKIESCVDKFLPLVWSSDAGRKQPLCRLVQCSESMVETWARVALDEERPALRHGIVQYLSGRSLRLTHVEASAGPDGVMGVCYEGRKESGVL